MPVTHVSKDFESLTMTVVAEFDVPVRRLWDAYLDPRQLERFWGPPTYPATFTRHDGRVGGRSEYAMTGPDGDVSAGYWDWIAVEELTSFEVTDGFAVPEGSDEPPVVGTPEGGIGRMVFAFEATPTGSRVTTTTHFHSLADLEQLRAMGMEQGMTLAMGQMDAVLADDGSVAAG